MMQTGIGSQEDLVVGYFSEGANAHRAINELIDEGFRPPEIGAAFRTRPAGGGPAGMGEGKGVLELTERNPALSGSAGGPASHDQSVTPAGLAPGAGSTFPGAPTTPGPIPGGEVPPTLPHDLPEMLPHDLPSTLRAESATDAAFPYSESIFEGSFAGMGLSPEHARGLSGELGRGGAVVIVSAAGRTSLAEAILERNHGRVRFEYAAGTTTPRIPDRESPVEIYGSMRNYYRPDEEVHRKAS